MKKLFIFLGALMIPLSVFADVEFFLSSDGEVYNPNTWTSEIFPDSSSGYIGIRYNSSISPIPNEYIVVDSVVKELLTTITSQTGSIDYKTQEIEQFETNYYETLISTENPQFIEYIITSINPQTETIIEEKLSQNIVLTPFEEVFYNCKITLEEREEIVLDVLEKIDSGEIENLESIRYSDPKFGDCIIPFPDVTHRETVQENSFTSNQLLAKTILGEETKYEVHETIENIITQESEYQESIIENEVHLSELLQQGIITSSQYKQNQDITSYYQDTIRNTDISYQDYTLLVQEFDYINEINKHFGGFLQQGIISQDEYSTFLGELEKIAELQRYFLGLLQSGEISSEEYREYIKEGEIYLKNKKDTIESYNQGIISEEEYNKDTIKNQNLFEERYTLFSEFFGNIEVNKPLGNIIYIYIIIVICVFGGLGALVLISLKRYKKRLGNK